MPLVWSMVLTIQPQSTESFTRAVTVLHPSHIMGSEISSIGLYEKRLSSWDTRMINSENTYGCQSTFSRQTESDNATLFLKMVGLYRNHSYLGFLSRNDHLKPKNVPNNLVLR